MNEKLLLVISFIGGLLGIFSLFLLSENIDYNVETIEKINSERIQDMIMIKGKILNVNNVGNLSFISISQPSSIDVIVFDEVTLIPGENVEIIGKGEEYKGEMEVIAHRIRVI